MAKHLYLVFTNAKPGREAEFEAWYDNRHIPDVLKISGIVNAQRYTLSPQQRRPDQPWRYLTVFEIETDELGTVIAELTRRLGTPDMPGCDALDPVLESHFFDPVPAPRGPATDL